MFDARRFGKSLVLAAVLGFAAFMLSASGLSWVLAAGVFYYDYVVRKDMETSGKSGKK